LICRAHENCFRRAFFCLLLFVVSTLFIISPALADKKNELRSEISTLKNSLEKTQRQLTSAEQDLESLDKRIARTSASIASLRKDIRDERRELARVQAERGSVAAQRESHDDVVRDHIKSMYLIGRQPTMKIVLNQESPAITGRLLKYFEYLNQAYLKEITLLTHQQVKLETMGARLEEHTSRLSSLLERHQTKLRDYESQRAKRRTIVASLKNRQENTQISLDRLLADQSNLERLATGMGKIVERKKISPASGIGFAKLKGSLPWPVNGKLIAKFGRSRLASGQLNWRGLLIRADEGDSVANVADGRVVFSDWLRGYGYVVIVDHGNEFMSLYGHNQALFREVGETVKQGDILALVGQTGSKNTPALYFEIRHHGDPINPQGWIQARR